MSLKRRVILSIVVSLVYVIYVPLFLLIGVVIYCIGGVIEELIIALKRQVIKYRLTHHLNATTYIIPANRTILTGEMTDGDLSRFTEVDTSICS